MECSNPSRKRPVLDCNPDQGSSTNKSQKTDTKVHLFLAEGDFSFTFAFWQTLPKAQRSSTRIIATEADSYEELVRKQGEKKKAAFEQRIHYLKRVGQITLIYGVRITEEMDAEGLLGRLNGEDRSIVEPFDEIRLSFPWNGLDGWAKDKPKFGTGGLVSKVIELAEKLLAPDGELVLTLEAVPNDIYASSMICAQRDSRRRHFRLTKRTWFDCDGQYRQYGYRKIQTDSHKRLDHHRDYDLELRFERAQSRDKFDSEDEFWHSSELHSDDDLPTYHRCESHTRLKTKSDGTSFSDSVRAIATESGADQKVYRYLNPWESFKTGKEGVRLSYPQKRTLDLWRRLSELWKEAETPEELRLDEEEVARRLFSDVLSSPDEESSSALFSSDGGAIRDKLKELSLQCLSSLSQSADSQKDLSDLVCLTKYLSQAFVLTAEEREQISAFLWNSLTEREEENEWSFELLVAGDGIFPDARFWKKIIKLLRSVDLYLKVLGQFKDQPSQLKKLLSPEMRLFFRSLPLERKPFSEGYLIDGTLSEILSKQNISSRRFLWLTSSWTVYQQVLLRELFELSTDRSKLKKHVEQLRSYKENASKGKRGRRLHLDMLLQPCTFSRFREDFIRTYLFDESHPSRCRYAALQPLFMMAIDCGIEFLASLLEQFDLLLCASSVESQIASRSEDSEKIASYWHQLRLNVLVYFLTIKWSDMGFWADPTEPSRYRRNFRNPPLSIKALVPGKLNERDANFLSAIIRVIEGQVNTFEDGRDQRRFSDRLQQIKCVIDERTQTKSDTTTSDS